LAVIPVALIGYMRVSTRDQNLDLQRDALEKAGADRVYGDEGVSGATSDRPELIKAMDYCRDGDTFVVWKLDRLGRSTRQVLDLVEQLREKGVGFRSLTEGLDTSGPMGTAMITVMAAFAQLERDVMIERTRAGLAAAAARGKRGGRTKLLDEKKVAELKHLRAQGFTVSRLAEMFRVSEPSVYRYLNA
jgi:DNA invertase Pin-like site-specific DNA recombinase